MTALATSALTAAELEAHARNGYHIARGLFSAEETARIRDTFMEFAKDGPVEGISETVRHVSGRSYTPDDPLHYYPRMMHPHGHPKTIVGPLALRYLLDPRVGDILRTLLNDEPIAAQSMFYFKPPGARGQDFHQDNFYLRVRPGSCIAAWTAVDDADEENGGMSVVPGTHNLDMICPTKSDFTQFFTDHHVEIPPGYNKVTPQLRAGDVLFFNGSLIHGSYSNTSKTRFRRSLICHYVPASCIEVAQGYKPLLRFDGTVADKESAQGGGPCGNAVPIPDKPH